MKNFSEIMRRYNQIIEDLKEAIKWTKIEAVIYDEVANFRNADDYPY